jgi:hypothetical protein
MNDHCFPVQTKGDCIQVSETEDGAFKVYVRALMNISIMLQVLSFTFAVRCGGPLPIGIAVHGLAD